MPERRVAELPPPLQLAGEEARDVVTRCELDRARVGLERLDEDAARRVAAAASGELGQQLERPLLGAEIRHAQPRVGVDDRCERNSRKVVSLRDHLCADEHDAVAFGEAA